MVLWEDEARGLGQRAREVERLSRNSRSCLCRRSARSGLRVCHVEFGLQMEMGSALGQLLGTGARRDGGPEGGVKGGVTQHIGGSRQT